MKKIKIYAGLYICISIVIFLSVVAMSEELDIEETSMVVEEETTTNEIETTENNWGVKIEHAQYYDYDDQGRLIEDHIIIGKTDYNETTIDNRTEEEKIRESKYKEAMEIIRESKRESEKESQIKYMEDIIKEAEHIKANQNKVQNNGQGEQQLVEEKARQASIEAKLNNIEVARNEQESMLNKVLEEARRQSRTTQPKSSINSNVPNIIDAEVDTSIDNNIQKNINDSATESMVETELPTQAIVIEKETVNVVTLVATTSFVEETVSLNDSLIESNVQKIVGNNKNKETKNIFVVVKDFFVNIFGKIFHK